MGVDVGCACVKWDVDGGEGVWDWVGGGAEGGVGRGEEVACAVGCLGGRVGGEAGSDVRRGVGWGVGKQAEVCYRRHGGQGS